MIMLFELMELSEAVETDCRECPRRARYRLAYRTVEGTLDVRLCPRHTSRKTKELVARIEARTDLQVGLGG